jgi:hypothetical protein
MNMALKAPSLSKANEEKLAALKAEQEAEDRLKAEQAAAEAEDVLEEEEDDTPLPAAAPKRDQIPVVHASTEIAPAPAASGMTINAPIAGFEDVDDDIGYGSYPVLKLDGKDFMCEGETFETVDVVLLEQRNKFLYKARPGKQDEEVPVAYSYDERTTVTGRPLTELFAEWQDAGEMEEGASPIVAKYKEVVAEVRNSGSELDGELVLLSVPPASRSRLAGYIKKLAMKRMVPQSVITRCQPGNKVVRGKTSFYPWDFKLVGPAN